MQSATSRGQAFSMRAASPQQGLLVFRMGSEFERVEKQKLNGRNVSACGLLITCICRCVVVVVVGRL